MTGTTGVRKAFFPIVALAAVFVGLTGSVMPERVASHFVAGGAANGFMARGAYLAMMVALVVLVPSGTGLAGALAGRLPPELVNLPNKAYWMAPERRASTLASLGTFLTCAAYFTLAALCVLHGFVVRANAHTPPELDATRLAVCMAALLVALSVAMLVVVVGRFFRVP